MQSLRNVCYQFSSSRQVKLKRSSNILDRLRAKRQELLVHQCELALPAHMSLSELTRQCGRQWDWETLHGRLLMGTQLARSYFNEEVKQELLQALWILTHIHADEPGRQGRWFTTSSEAQVLGTSLVLTDEMEAKCDAEELYQASRAVALQLI